MTRPSEEVMRFVESQRKYVKAVQRLSNARDSYEGYSPDWALSRQIRDADEAAIECAEAFRVAVLSVIAQP